MTKEKLLCVAVVLAPHGVRGAVKVRGLMTSPEDIFALSALTDEKGEREFKLAKLGAGKDCFVVSISGINTREEAEAAKGLRLFAPRSRLPPPRDGEYYEADLKGLAVYDAKDGKPLGKVLMLHDYGAGAFLEIGRDAKDSFMLPFSDACVPEIDVKAGKAIAVVPEEWLNDE